MLEETLAALLKIPDAKTSLKFLSNISIDEFYDAVSSSIKLFLIYNLTLSYVDFTLSFQHKSLRKNIQPITSISEEEESTILKR